MRDDDVGDRHVTVDLGQCPYPAAHVSVVSERPVVTRVNTAFQSTFGIEPTDAPLADVLDRVLDSPDSAALAPRLTQGGWTGRPITVDSDHVDDGDPTEYVVQAVDDATESTAYLLYFNPHVPGTDSQSTVCDVGPEQVASIVSHDLRNPLDVARANLRAARETGDDEYFETVSQAHDRMERIIQDVLTLAREDEVIDPSETVNVEQLITNAWEAVDTRDADLAIQSPLPETTVDTDRAERLLENLFRNAVDHGGPSPTVRVGSLDGDAAGFYVADDGPGVPPADRETVFEPGYTSTDHGTGLGLSIVDRIASAHGWQVRLTDSEDGGARFELEVPEASEAN